MAGGVHPPGVRQAGARLIIVNRNPTPLDRTADAVVRGEIGAVLPSWSAPTGEVPLRQEPAAARDPRASGSESAVVPGRRSIGMILA